MTIEKLFIMCGNITDDTIVQFVIRGKYTEKMTYLKALKTCPDKEVCSFSFSGVNNKIFIYIF